MEPSRPAHPTSRAEAEVQSMPELLTSVLHQGAEFTYLPACLYTSIVAIATASAALARCPERRRDAREVLKILLMRRRG